MSRLHPIIAVTGSSGAGTSYMRRAFEYIFRSQGLNAAIIEGDSFHRYNRAEMQAAVKTASANGLTITHFSPTGNILEELEALFHEYALHGSGKRRYYIHNEHQAEWHHQQAGTFTDWEPLPSNTDLLFYEGLHGAINTDTLDMLQYVDLSIGVAPIINLEWIQKIQRDRDLRGYSLEATMQIILSRMHDYIHYIIPQFSHTDINFQRVPTVDTANPFAHENIPGDDESFVIIHIRNQRKIKADFRALLDIVEGSFLSRPDTLVIPAAKKFLTIALLIEPVIERMMERKNLPVMPRGDISQIFSNKNWERNMPVN